MKRLWGACIRSVISSMGLPLPPPMKTDFHDITERLLKVALSTVNLNLNLFLLELIQIGTFDNNPGKNLTRAPVAPGP